MIYVIRHGQTELNSAHALQGRSNHPLNGKGVEQARVAAQLLSARGIVFSHVFSSPLQRAIQTAEIVAPGVSVTTDDRLIEMDYGPYEGTDLNNLPPEILTFFSDFAHNPAPDGMEQLSSVVERAGSFVDEIACLEGDVLISTHAIAMKGILEHLTPQSQGSYWSKYLGNCAVYAIEVADGALGVPFEMV